MYECITEYDREKVFAELKEEAIEEGIEIGKLEVALSMLKLGTMPKEDIAVVTGLTVERINQLAEQSNI